jgi:hypothetical protein
MMAGGPRPRKNAIPLIKKMVTAGFFQRIITYDSEYFFRISAIYFQPFSLSWNFRSLLRCRQHDDFQKRLFEPMIRKFSFTAFKALR